MRPSQLAGPLALALPFLLAGTPGCGPTVIVLDDEAALLDDPDLKAGCTPDVWSRAIAAEMGPNPASLAAGPGCTAVVVGSFRSPIDFGAGTLISAGGADVFVAKLGPAGEVLWSTRLGGPGDEQAGRVAVGRDGSVAVAVHTGTGDLFTEEASAGLVWFDAQGNQVGEQPLGRVLAPVRITGMAMDRGGATSVTGYFQGSVDFGGGEVSSVGLDDIFVARYEADGSLGFLRTFGDANHQSGAGGLALDRKGNIFVTGSFRGTIDLGEGPISNGGDEDVYLLKLSPAGDTLWARTFGDTGHQEAAPIAVSREGRVAIAGTFEGELDFGGSLLQSTEGHHFNLFVAQFDADGEHRFSMRFGDVHAEEAIGLGFAPEGHLVLAGHFGGSMVIGDQGFVTKGAWDLYAVRFDQAGTPVASRQFGDQYAQRCEGLAVDPLGQVLMTGTFEGALDFGHGGGPLTGSAGDADGFVSRLSL